MQFSDDSAEAAIDETTREDALRVLERLLTFHLLPELWAEREDLARTLVQALESGDVRTARSVTIELEVLDDQRVDLIVSPDSIPPTEPVRELVGRLIHLPDQRDTKPGSAETDRAKPDR